MASLVDTELLRLEKQYRDRFEECRRYGDNTGAEYVHQAWIRERETYERTNNVSNIFSDALNSVVGTTGYTCIGAINTATGIAQQHPNAQLLQNAFVAKQETEFKPEFGVLYLHNKELPADWAGAKITSFQRRVRDKNWHVQFESKWDKALEINLYLDVEELNGREVNEMARTYMEALNQRRVG